MNEQLPNQTDYDVDPAIARLEDFCARHKGKLTAIIGGALVLSVLGGAMSPAKAEDRPEIAALRASMDLPTGDQFGVGVMAAQTPENTFYYAKEALNQLGDLDVLEAGIENRREKLETAARELDNLKAAIENAQGLNDADYLEAVAAAADIYNESVAEAQLGFDAEIDPETASEAALGSSSDILRALHQGY